MRPIVLLDDGRLVLNVPLTWRVETLVIDLDGEVGVVARATGDLAWPDFLTPLGADQYTGGSFFTVNAVPQTLQALSLFGRSLDTYATEDPFALWDYAPQLPTSAWGGTAIMGFFGIFFMLIVGLAPPISHCERAGSLPSSSSTTNCEFGSVSLARCLRQASAP